LQQVTEAIVFMRTGELGKTKVSFVGGVVRVEITRGFLGGDDVADEGIDIAFELSAGGVGRFVRSERPSGGFNPFVEVGIGIQRPAAGKIGAAFETAEVIDDAVLFEKQEQRRETALSDDTAARGPETIADVDGLDRDRMLAGVGRFIEENDALLIPGGEDVFPGRADKTEDERAGGEAAKG